MKNVNEHNHTANNARAEIVKIRAVMKMKAQMSNMFDRAQDEPPRTNNACDGWHRRFQSNVGAYHPSIWKFLKVLQREEAACIAEVVQLVAGYPPLAKRQKYKGNDSRVLRLVESYNSTN